MTNKNKLLTGVAAIMTLFGTSGQSVTGQSKPQPLKKQPMRAQTSGPGVLFGGSDLRGTPVTVYPRPKKEYFHDNGPAYQRLGPSPREKRALGIGGMMQVTSPAGQADPKPVADTVKGGPKP